MALNGTIKVDTDVLIAKAAVVEEKINKVEKYFDTMKNIVVSSGKYWEGEAGNMHRKVFLEKQDMLSEILNRFKEHSTDLVKMSDNYRNTENVVEEQLVNQLPENVII